MPNDMPLLAAIADDFPIAIWVARAPSGELVFANRAFVETMGMDARSDVAAGEYATPYGIYRRGAGLYPESELPFPLVLKTRAPVELDDILIRRRDGRDVNVRAWAKPLFDEKGAFVQVAVAFADISREVAAETARAEAERRLRFVIDAAPLILFALDTQGTVTLSEGRGLKRLGAVPAGWVGRSAKELYADNPGVLDNLRRAASGEEFLQRTQIGEVTLETAFSPLRDEAGTVVGTVGLSLDVSEQEQLHQQLLQSERMAAMGTG